LELACAFSTLSIPVALFEQECYPARSNLPGSALFAFASVAPYYFVSGAMSKSKLEAIRDQRALDIIEAKAAVPVESLVQKLADGPFAQRKPLCLRERLETLLKNGETCLAAEFKRASPSKGDIASSASIRADDVAMLYADGGASVMSVLTEPKWFKGSLEDMNAARDALDVRQTKMTEAGQAVLRPLVLRKDFLIDEYQIHEARAYGADTLLLIVAILKDELLASLIKCARSLGMEPLVEVNNEVELESALAAGARVIGVNNRNLHTFQLDMTTTSRLADLLRSRGLLLEASNVENPGSGTVVLAALSGISSRADVEKYREEGVNCVLVGESLMRSVDPVKAMRVLRGVTQEQKVRVKICGNTNVEDSVAGGSKHLHYTPTFLCGENGDSTSIYSKFNFFSLSILPSLPSWS
jgi:anthranilate synthase/indole-3-glycerol phosphate synthase/phosphoribosylanthranilate isomerase